MENIKRFLSLYLIKGYESLTVNNKANKLTEAELNLLKIVNNKPQSDYKLALPGIWTHLITKGKNISLDQLGEELSKAFPNSDFACTFDSKSRCILINLQLSYMLKMLYPLNQPILRLNSYGSLPASLCVLGDKKTKRKQNILVEFSSPNIAKDMHVGHLRSTIIGDSIAKLLEFQQHNVLRINHIGDFGLQFGMIIEYLLRLYPDYETKKFDIADLQTFYAQSKKEFDSNPDFAKSAYEKVVLLQTGDPFIVKAWNYIKDVSREAYNEIYSKLDISLTECGESFYQSRIPDMISELEKCDPPIMVEEEGRKIIRVPGEELVLTVQKSDGGYTYDTTDLAAARYRLLEIQPRLDRVIYVVDSGQAKHFELIFWVARRMGWLHSTSTMSVEVPEVPAASVETVQEAKDEEEVQEVKEAAVEEEASLETQELIHVGFGLICGPDGKKFKSREGDTVKLKDLLQDSLTASQALVRGEHTLEERNQIAEAVAYGSIKYADLRSLRLKDYNFSTERMLTLKGNTGVYQLYEYVRICSIFRKAANLINLDQLATEVESQSIAFSLSDDLSERKYEVNLCTTLLTFPEIIEKIEVDFYLHTLCDYLYNLSDAFSKFHTNCRVLSYLSKSKEETINKTVEKTDNVEKDPIHVNKNRLLLCLYTKKVMEACLKILGLRLLEKM